jgi:hypothetical protein
MTAPGSGVIDQLIAVIKR